MKVLNRDKEARISELKIALNMVGIAVDYPSTELIKEIIDAQEKFGRMFNIKQAIKIQIAWEEKWELYGNPVEEIKETVSEIVSEDTLGYYKCPSCRHQQTPSETPKSLSECKNCKEAVVFTYVAYPLA